MKISYERLNQIIEEEVVKFKRLNEAIELNKFDAAIQDLRGSFKDQASVDKTVASITKMADVNRAVQPETAMVK